MKTRSSYPTAAFAMHHPSAHCMQNMWENMNFIARTRAHLLAGECDEVARLNGVAMILYAAQKARRNHTSAKCFGHRLP